MGADEFRDYILGFIFFKFLSERMESFANDILEGEDFKIMKAKKKYNKGGSVGRSYDKDNPTPTERTLTPDEVRISGTSENQGYSNPYAKVNKPVTAKDILEKTEMSRLTEALRKDKYSTANLSLGDMRKIAKTKGLYDSARELAREDYRKWLAKNRK